MRSHDKAAAQECIDWLLAKKKPDGGYAWSIQASIVQRELSLLCDISEGDVLRGLNAAEEDSNKVVEVVLFQNVVSTLPVRARDTEILNSYTFVFPFNADVDSAIPADASLVAYGNTFHFRDWDEVERLLEGQLLDLLEPATSYHLRELVTRQRIVSVVQAGSSWEMAWQDLIPAFDTFLGLVDFHINKGSARFFGIGTRATIPHPDWVLAYSTNPTKVEGSYAFLIDESTPSGPFKFSPTVLDFLVRASEPLAEVPPANSTLELVANCLRLYSEAVHKRFDDACFVHFWQLLEAASLGGSSKQIQQRLSWLGPTWHLPGSGIREILTSFGKIRNDIVHRGQYVATHEDINIIKIISEGVINWLVGIADDLPTQNHLRQFYASKSLHPSVLEAMIETASFLIKDRP